MTFKSQDQVRNRRGDQSSVGAIVFLMMALVFVPLMAVHVAMAWPDRLAFAPQQLAAMVSALLAL